MASYEKRGKCWRVVFDEAGQRKTISGHFHTKKEAVAAYEEYLANGAAAADEKQTAPLFGDVLDKYIAYQATQIREASLYDERHKIDAQIRPTLGDKRADDISPADITQWQTAQAAFSYRYRKALHQLLGHVFRFAADTYGLPNPMEKIKAPRNTEGKKDMLIWTPEQFARFRDALPDSWRLCFTFLYTTGCRRGEMMALTWADVRQGRAFITKSVTHHSADGWKTTPTKNDGSNRSVILEPSTAEALEARRAAISPDPAAFVFGGPHGDGTPGTSPCAPETLRRTMQAAAAAAGVTTIRVHDLRHSCASFLLHSGVSIVAVSKHLGHSNTQQTLDTYAHLMPKDDDLVRDALTAAITKK